MGRAMASTAPVRKFRISRDTVFWVLAAVAMIIVGILLDVYWGNL